MNNQVDIYKDFKGYNSYPIQESERIIRERHMGNFIKCAGLIKNCEDKARDGRSVKILEKVMVLRKKISNLENEFEKKSNILKTADARIKIDNVDEEKLKKIDYKVAEAMAKIAGILGSMKCAETDMFINTKFSDINKYLNEIETECRERLLVFLKTK